ncbi:hypothetical protein VNI00_010480 [Paramarasmius palmivorus]|uniref:F-box domain-containing protein n=1 Tax=Paramarasmius palmivorus TaxID=297713 RepID=A0AAW0CG68_9AGAR
MLKEPQEKLDSLDKKIVHLQDVLRGFISQRDAIRSYVDQHRAIISHFRRLPADVIREIFIQCLPTNHYPVRSITQAPLLLTRICRFWREIAISTPQLWNIIHVHIPQLVAEVDLEAHLSLIHKRKDGVERWLKRSGTLPISLSFSVDARPLFYFDTSHHAQHNMTRARRMEHTMAFVAMLFQFASRWKLISFRVPLSVLIATSSQIVGPRTDIAPRLEFFELDIVSDNAFGEEPQFGSTHAINAGNEINRFPAVRRIRVYNDMQSPLLLLLTWHNLVEVVFHPLNGIPPIQALKILSMTCQNLEKCSMSIRVPWGTNDRGDILIELPKLRILRLAFYKHLHQDPDLNLLQHSDLRDFFQQIHAPSLTELSVVARFAVDMPEVPFLSFLGRSSLHLKTLRINIPLAEQTLIQCLRLCPSISVLSVTELQPPTEYPWDTRDAIPPTISAAIMRNLTPANSPDYPLLCPRLENLCFRNCATRDVRSMLALVTSRWRQSCDDVARLKAFSVSFKHDIGGDYVEEIDVLRKEGLRIQWVHEKRHQAMDSPDHGMMYHEDPRDLDPIKVEGLDTDWI